MNIQDLLRIYEDELYYMIYVDVCPKLTTTKKLPWFYKQVDTDKWDQYIIIENIWTYITCYPF